MFTDAQRLEQIPEAIANADADAIGNANPNVTAMLKKVCTYVLYPVQIHKDLNKSQKQLHMQMQMLMEMQIQM